MSLSPVTEGSEDDEKSISTIVEQGDENETGNVKDSDYQQYVRDDVQEIMDERSAERKEDAVQSQRDITANPAVQKEADDDRNINNMDTLQSESKQGGDDDFQRSLPNLDLFDDLGEKNSRKRPRSPTVGGVADEFDMDTDGSDEEQLVDSPEAKKRRLQIIRRVYMHRKRQLHSSYLNECARIQRQYRPRRTGSIGDVQGIVSRRGNRKLAAVKSRKQTQ